MSKSRANPRYRLFQLVIQDFKHRQPPPKNMYVDKSGKGVREIVDTIPEITKLKWAKDNRQAARWGRKFGSVIACFKVESHEYRLKMIEHLRLEPRPIEVDISPEEFVVGRDLIVEPVAKTKKIEVDDSDEGAIDK